MIHSKFAGASHGWTGRKSGQTVLMMVDDHAVSAKGATSLSELDLPLASMPTQMNFEQVVALLSSGALGSTELHASQYD
jgi:hypothetical protein